METLTSSATIVSSPFYLPIFSPKSKDPSSIGRRILRFSISPKNNVNESELRSDSNDSSLVPILSNRTLSTDAAMGLVLSAANVRGWTIGSSMEGPPVPAGSESEPARRKSPPSPGPSSPSRHGVVCVLPSLAMFVVSKLRVQSIPMPTPMEGDEEISQAVLDEQSRTTKAWHRGAAARAQYTKPASPITCN